MEFLEKETGKPQGSNDTKQQREGSRLGMKSTGIVRKVDELGRIVLPIELRNTLGISPRDAVEIYSEGDTIVLKKFENHCTFCNSTKGLHEYKGKQICTRCKNEIARKE